MAHGVGIHPRRIGAAWQVVRDQHTEAVNTVASYELDAWKAIEYPGFNDVTVAEVSLMTKAMGRARNVEFRFESDSEIPGSDGLLAEYRGAVEDLANAVAVAEAAAKRIRWKAIPADERKDLKLAKKLLAQAEDPGSPEQPRHPAGARRNCRSPRRADAPADRRLTERRGDRRGDSDARAGAGLNLCVASSRDAKMDACR